MSGAEVRVASQAEGFDLERVLDLLADKVERMLVVLPLLLVAAAILWIAWFIGTWLSQRTVLDRVSKRNPFLQGLVRTSIKWGVVLLGSVVALEILGATKLVGAVLGTAGVLGVALGFAFKDILENYLAGLLLSLRQPFAPRDWVVIDGNEGLVVALTSRATILMTLDGNHLRLPNALVFRSVALNYTRNPKRRLDCKVGIGVAEDIAHAQRVGIDALLRVQGVVDDPPPRALVCELADWSVVVSYQAWVDQRTHDFLLVRSEAVRVVKEALDRTGVEMPFPIHQVRLRRDEEAAPANPVDRPGGTPPAAATAVDTRVTDDVLQQVRAERDRHCGEDLLHPDAPRE